MTARVTVFVVLVSLALAVRPVGAQSAGRPPAVSRPPVGLLVPKPTTVPGTLARRQPAELALISHRAKVFGDRVSAAGIQYFAARDADLFGLSREGVLNRLNTTAVTLGVRRVEIVVDLKRPLVLHVGKTDPALVGTAIVSAEQVRNLEVRSTIFANQIVVLRR